ncbi:MULTISPECIES: sulfite exporter TauE/SafE family protein [unclassified Pseudomonas]|uniref:sulfite exporter TauE/SafE family protein n=1 Tax=unclassified Pseudomonas TaxID=196821 RepID=UPI002AC93E6F|nr:MULTISPECIES: sulfite exporter TauE/SafE family protein [unclassified Pseudomonas]MEB0047884.1 sulfite exporter TauE/SafE family protein [Pseudomonas sp. Dout3]MEB0098965.1 sulfite exporter TauE/SafE family protein [Pseudomonas sp. DC1.2]WPX57605.1 sulfite exporter TauE/SafE family protein [Pseudomonas sp. DC1.2]
MFYLLLTFFGCISGLTAVLFGFGGGFVVVPLLYRMLMASHGADDPIGQSAMHIAVATSTCVMIVNALIATLKHQRAGHLIRHYLWPLGGFIGVGAIVGAAAAVWASGEMIRYAFIVYLGITILDCVFRRGFLTQPNDGVPRRLRRVEAAGVGIGAIATFLGVGGSVMTVPLLRRCGLSMSQATSMANPLSLPVAVAGTLTYMTMAGVTGLGLGPWFIGYVDLLAFALLTLGALVGIWLATPWRGRIPDSVHARVYIGLLMLVMFSMTLNSLA